MNSNNDESVSCPLHRNKLHSTENFNEGLSRGTVKERKKLPVFIVEQHNDVLQFIHRAIGSRKLPFSEVLFIHFDSHPDLLIPIHLDADMVMKPQQLYESISIENWLLPLAYAKHVNHIVWIKPPWAHQIKPSCQNFTIGKCQESGKLRLNCKENYFLTDGLFCPTNRLVNSCDVKLTVAELCPENWSSVDTSFKQRPEAGDYEGDHSQGNLFHRYKLWAEHLQTTVKDQPYILDMDLDFFSTANPFKGMFSEFEENALKRLYRCPLLKGMADEEVSEYTSLRETQLDKLEILFSNVEGVWTQKTDPIPESELQISLSEITGTSEEFLQFFNSEERNAIMSLCQSLLQSDRKARDITFDQLHDFGCTLDDTELPHHISSEDQVMALEEALTVVMNKLPKPAVVTISRSSHDEYCPSEKVDLYQAMFLNILKKCYGEMEITENY